MEERLVQLDQRPLVVKVARWTLEELKVLELQERHLVVQGVMQLFMAVEAEVAEEVVQEQLEVMAVQVFGEGEEGEEVYLV
jgi:hypothetical protein